MNNQWYQLRDKRTDALMGVTSAYKSVSVAVFAGKLSEKHHQTMFITTLNVLSRWCNNIHIYGQDAPSILSLYSNGASRSTFAVAREILTGNNPYGTYHFDDEDNSADFDIALSIGKTTVTCDSPFVSIDCNGWIASCSFNGYGACDNGVCDIENPLSAVFAACLANAEVFRWSLNRKAQPYIKWYSLLDFEVSTSPIYNKTSIDQNLVLPRMHIVGCGAIGSSFIWLLSLTEWKGDLLLVDMDKEVELHNTSSSLLFSGLHISKGLTKVNTCKDHLSNTNFNISEFTEDYGTFDYNHLLPDKSADIIACFANDKNIWFTMQNFYPPPIFHATTSSSWGVNIGRHIPYKDENICCTFKDHLKMVYVPKCAEVELPAEQEPASEEKPSAILPFLSPCAAVIALAQIYHYQNGQVTKDNSLEFNMESSAGIFLSDFFKPSACPICGNQKKEIYDALYNSEFTQEHTSTFQNSDLK